MEPVYTAVAGFIRIVWRIQGLKITVSGQENIPHIGGAVIAGNHTGYLDFPFTGLPAYRLKPHRWVRFMAKEEVFTNRYSGPIMRGCKHIAVDRDNGAESFRTAVNYLKAGELVGIYPEGAISRSFELKEFKSGVARMAQEAHVPIIPHIVWGAQRIWTKDHPRQLGRTKIPIRIIVGEPIGPDRPQDELLELLHSRMQCLLDQAQEEYGSHPSGEFWVPRRLGGSAPTLEEALRLDEQEAQYRADKISRKRKNNKSTKS